MGVVMHVLSRKVRRQAKPLGVRYQFFFMQASASQLRELGALYDSGQLRPVIDRTFTFDQTLEAMAYVEHATPRPARSSSRWCPATTEIGSVMPSETPGLGSVARPDETVLDPGSRQVAEDTIGTNLLGIAALEPGRSQWASPGASDQEATTT
jgi:hypothetical protein